MKSDHRNFFLSLLCVMALGVVLTLMLKHIIPQFVTPYWSLQILFFALVNIVIYFVGVKIKSSGNTDKMTNFYMLTTMVKLVTYLAILLIYALIFPADAKSFIITFMMYYLCFTIFETFYKIKTNNQR